LSASIADSTPSVALEDAIKTAEAALGGQVNDHPATVEYVALDDNTAVLAHVFQVQDEATGMWVEAFVDAHANKLVSINDFVTSLTVGLPCVWSLEACMLTD
jgi:extracellular elastinolytic metalloproteinase